MSVDLLVTWCLSGLAVMKRGSDFLFFCHKVTRARRETKQDVKFLFFAHKKQRLKIGLNRHFELRK